MFLSNKPKIVATYRSIPEVLTSYISLIERTQHENNFIDEHLIKDNLPITNNNRAEHIWRYYVAPSYESMIYGITKYPEWVHLVEYNNLVKTVYFASAAISIIKPTIANEDASGKLL